MLKKIKKLKNGDDIKVTKNKAIKIKQSPFWNFAYLYLQMLEEFTVLMEDKEFYRLYNQLLEYVQSKIELSHPGDIIDEYVIIE